jgi:hypothetical protein
MRLRVLFALLLAIIGAAACAPIPRHDGVPAEELQELVSALRSGRLNEDTLAWLSAANRSDLVPIFFRSGIHCLDPSKEESYHRLELYAERYSGTITRVVIWVTLVPAVSMFDQPASVVDLLRDREVTQFQVWSEGPRHDHPGEVISYKARAPLPGCGVVG